MKLFKSLLLFLVSLILVACSAPATNDAQLDGVVSATNSPQPPTATLKPTQTAILAPTLTPTAFIPTLDLAGITTVEPSDLAITSNNFQRIEILAELGKGRLNDAAISPDGTIIAAATSRGVYLYAADSLEEFAFLDAGSTSLVEFAPNGEFLLTDVEKWDMDKLEGGYYLRGGSGGTRFVGGAISPDGNYVAMTAEIREGGDPLFSIQGWDLRTGEKTFAFQEIAAYFTDINFSPDGMTLAAAGIGGRLTLFDVQSGEVIFELEDRISSAAFSPDGEALLLSDGRIWDLSKQEFQDFFEDFDAKGFNVSFSPDGSKVIFYPSYAGSDVVTVWDVASREKVYGLNVSGITNVSISEDQQLMVTPTYDNELHIWDFNTGELLNIIREFNAGLGALEFEMYGTGFAVGDNDGGVFLWDGETASLVQTYASNFERVNDFSFSSNDQVLAIVGMDWGDSAGHFDLLDTQNALQILTTNDVCSVIANQDVMVISYEGRVEVFNSSTGLVEKTFLASCLNNLVISADGNTVVGSKDSSVIAYDVTSGQEKWRDDSNVEVGSSFAFSIEDLALSFDDQYLSAAVTNGIVYIWDAVSGELFHSLEAHQPFANEGPPSGVTAVTFSPDELLLVSGGGDDGTLAFWDPLSGELFGRLGPISVHGYLFPTWNPDNLYSPGLRAQIRDIGAMRFSPDGQYLALGGSSGILYLFGLPR